MFSTALIIETAILIGSAYLIGCVAGHVLRRTLHAARGTHRPQPVAVTPPPPVAKPVPQIRRPVSPAARLAARADEPIDIPKRLPATPQPPALAMPHGGRADDLKLIKGIGPKIEAALNKLGIYHFDQIATWTRAEAEWIDTHLGFKGRVARERWVEQATGLLKAAA